MGFFWERGGGRGGGGGGALPNLEEKKLESFLASGLSNFALFVLVASLRPG